MILIKTFQDPSKQAFSDAFEKREAKICHVIIYDLLIQMNNSIF